MHAKPTQTTHAAASRPAMQGGRQGPCLTQAERLYAALRRRAMTTMEMLDLGISVAPWKRVVEGQHHLRAGERIVKGQRKGLVTYAVRRGCK